ncbi:unnamed protein product [Ixodes pacificus]
MAQSLRTHAAYPPEQTRHFPAFLLLIVISSPYPLFIFLPLGFRKLVWCSTSQSLGFSLTDITFDWSLG